MDETELPVHAQVEIRNQKGLHARASAKFVKLASNYEGTQIYVVRDGTQVDAQSIMGLLMLGAGKGSMIEIEARGPQAQQAVDALVALVSNLFDEGE